MADTQNNEFSLMDDRALIAATRRLRTEEDPGRNDTVREELKYRIRSYLGDRGSEPIIGGCDKVDARLVKARFQAAGDAVRQECPDWPGAGQQSTSSKSCFDGIGDAEAETLDGLLEAYSRMGGQYFEVEKGAPPDVVCLRDAFENIVEDARQTEAQQRVAGAKPSPRKKNER